MRIGCVAGCFLLLWVADGSAQQVPDREYRPPVAHPAYPPGAGPTICIDEAHNNFHTMGNRFWAFAELARRDGYDVEPNTQAFSPASLATCRVLVIANAGRAQGGPPDQVTPFTTREIETVRAWVDAGGALLLVADHRPYGSAAAPLAEAFDVIFTDGFAVDGYSPETGRVSRPGPAAFSRADGTLRAHPIADGRTAAEAVGEVRTFTGQAFRGGTALVPLLVFSSGFVLLPDRPAQLKAGETGRPISGWLQGAVTSPGRGRAAFFGEAAMFTAQRSGPAGSPMGMNAPGADQNFQFVLNVLHWLTGLLGDR